MEGEHLRPLKGLLELLEGRHKGDTGIQVTRNSKLSKL